MNPWGERQERKRGVDSNVRPVKFELRHLRTGGDIDAYCLM